MKRLYFTLLFFACAILSVCAQKNITAKQVMDKTAAVVGRAGGASADFVYSSGTSVNATGTIYIKGNKFYTRTPNASVWYDGKTQWTYVKKSNEVNVATPSASKQSQMNPYRFINLYKNGYNMTMKTTGALREVHLVAQKNTSSISEAYIIVNKSFVPQTIKICQKGKWTNVTLSNFKAKDIADATFRFNSKDYPKAEIVDLR